MISETQLHWLRQQLDREPRGMEAIAVSTSEGIPLVVRMRSVVEGRPFPTLYWLSSKDLYKAISVIETNGYIKRLEAEIASDAELREALHASHQDYANQRLAMMRDEDKAALMAQDKFEYINRLGVGGIADWSRVRCLHMHYAHHLCGVNVIGQRLEQEFALSKLAIQL